MLISMNWINDFVDLSGIDIKSLINRFTLSTAEVEDIFVKGEDIKNVVTAKIVSVSDHPTSKKLHVLSVFDGEKEVQVVCGAPNVKVGMIVAFAKENGQVGELKINAVKVAGVESFGMCCSEKELGISDDHGGIIELDEDTILGVDIKTIFPIDDVIFEVDNKSLTNRPDLWGIYGIAREFAALSDRPLKAIDVSEFNDSLPPVSINIEDTKRCFRYSSVIIDNITKKNSPIYMKVRLFYCGMRSINLLADLTNYIMIELGQPMHAFDHKLVPNICVKAFENDIEFTTLDDVKRNVLKDTMMICTNDTPVCIAGVMGGKDSAINDDTSTVLLESANFDGVFVRKASTALGLRTDASARYEKIIDPELTVLAIGRFVKLLSDVDSEIVIKTKVTDIYSYKYPQINLEITKEFINRYTGIDIDDAAIIKTLTNLGFTVSTDDNKFSVTVPSYRATKDVTINADLIEEITRIYGYDNFEVKTTATDLIPVTHDEGFENEYYAKQYLAVEHNLNEVHSYIWNQSQKNKELGINTLDNVKIVNSLAAYNNTLRTHITPALLGFVSTNKTNFNEIGIFEIGHIVKGLKSDNTCNERKALSIVLASKSKNEQQLYYDVKEIIECLVKNIKNIDIKYCDIECTDLNYVHPKSSQQILINGENIGMISVLHPLIKNNIDKKMSVTFVEIDFTAFNQILSTPVKYVEISKYPGVELDLSFLMNIDDNYIKLEDCINRYSNDFLTKYQLVGIYTDDTLVDKKSVTIRFYFNNFNKTLSGDEINSYSQEIIDHVKVDGFVLR